MSANPYLITGPANISFSGGRTSAYMLRLILDAHGGTLPDDVHVCFANTGKEREETLRFVHECATRWGVNVRWLEWRPPGKSDVDRLRFTEVSHNSASRNGEPFMELMRRKQYLPNSQMRYCTIELKIRVMRDFMKSLGHETWSSIVGLRADEMHRVFKSIARNESGKERFKTVMPMASTGRLKAYGKTIRDVRAFWDTQPFDLGLMSHEGNCDLCFLKGRGKRAEIIRARPDLAEWWIEAEAGAKYSMGDGARFDATESVAQLVAAVKAQPMLALDPADDDEFDAECGTWCPGEAA